MQLLSTCLCMIFMLFYESILSNYLIATNPTIFGGENKALAGFFLSVGTFFYAFTSLMVSTLARYVHRRFLVFGAFLFCALA